MIVEAITALGSLAVSPVGSLALGGITGYFKKRQEAKQEIRLAELSIEHRELDLEELELEQTHTLAMADKAYDQAEMEGQYAVERVDASGFGEAIKIEAEKDPDALRYIKSAVRILITIGYTAATFWITWELSNLIGGLEGLGTSELTSLFQSCVLFILNVAAFSTAFWFHIRPNKQDKDRLYNN